MLVPKRRFFTSFSAPERQKFPKKCVKNRSRFLTGFDRFFNDFRPQNEKQLENIDKTIIFGCFVTLRKINDEVIRLWSNVLRKFPNTKIHFKSPELNDSLVAENLKNKFLNYAIKADRLILEKSSDYKSYLQSWSKHSRY